MKRTPRTTRDLRLKFAIMESRRTQRRVAVETKIGETRLSEIVGHRSTPATDDEKHSLLTYLNRLRVQQGLPVLEDADLWTPPLVEDDDAEPVTASADAKRAS